MLSEYGAPIAPSTYYDHLSRVPSRRELRDQRLKEVITTERAGSRFTALFGARKLWLHLRAKGHDVARCTVERLMGELGISVTVRGKKPPRTTIADTAAARPVDLVDRNFTALGPNRLWCADFTYVPTWSGMVYTAFVFDVLSRRILGWRVATSMTTDLVLDTLEMAVWTRAKDGHRDLSGLVHHTDAGSQYTSIAFTQRLVEAGVDASVGSVGDAYEVSQRREFHPPLLSEPGVTVSRHRAPTVEPVGIAPCFQ